jgi:predicted lipase
MKSLNPILIRAAELSEKVYSEEKDYLCDLTIPGYVFLAVEGTKEKTDWITNIKFLFKNKNRHRGFLSNAERTLTDFYCNGGTLPEDRILVLAGHSLGGATATMLAELLNKRFPDLLLVTFGSPRPGGRKFRDRMKNIEHYRYVHGDDVVPKTPPYLSGYVHITEEINLTDKDDRFADGVSDHNIGKYKEALKKTCKDIE